MLDDMKKTLFFTFLSASILQCAAVTVATTPGRLAEKLEGVAFTDRALTLTGIIGPEDYEVLRELEGVDRLDLSATRLTSTRLTPGLVEDGYWPESTVLPAYSLFASGYTEIILPQSLSEIREGALAGGRISRITIPEGVFSIGANAFYGNSALEKVSLPSALSRIGDGAFDGCAALREINLEATKVKYLPARFAANATALEALSASQIIEVGREALYGTSVSELDLSSARSVGPYALAGMKRLKKVSLKPGALIGEGVFMADAALEEVSGMPSEVAALLTADCSAFSPDKAIGEATYIGDFAFANTLADRLVLLPSLTRIGSGALAGCSDLTEIDARALAGYIPEVEKDTFGDVDVSDVHLIVAEGCENIWESHPVWGRFRIIGAADIHVATLPDESAGIMIGLHDGAVRASDVTPGIMMAVYTLEGRLALTVASEGYEVSLPLADLPDGPLVVKAIGKGGSAKTLKIIH